MQLASNESKKGRQHNRRVDTWVLNLSFILETRFCAPRQLRMTTRETTRAHLPVPGSDEAAVFHSSGRIPKDERFMGTRTAGLTTPWAFTLSTLTD